MQEEDITIINIYVSNIRARKYITQILTDLKGEIDSNTLIVGDFNTQLTSKERSSRKKINKKTLALNDTLDQIQLICIYRIFYPKLAEYTFLSSTHRPFSRIDYMLGHKTSLSKLKKIEIISSTFSNQNVMRLEINYKKKKCKRHKHVEAKQYATTQSMDYCRSNQKKKNTWRQMKMKTQLSKICGMQQKQF